jgi:hypothetical protein
VDDEQCYFVIGLDQAVVFFFESVDLNSVVPPKFLEEERRDAMELDFSLRFAHLFNDRQRPKDLQIHGLWNRIPNQYFLSFPLNLIPQCGDEQGL